MQSIRKELEKLDFCTLFTYRYILELEAKADERYLLKSARNKINLEQDILDLQYFPERLTGSYKMEWIVDIARISKGAPFSAQSIKNKVDQLELEQKQNLEQLLNIIQEANMINQNEKVKVIKSPLKSYIESLIKI